MATSSVASETGLPTGTWNVDPVHSNVEFKVKHVGVATVKGRFNEFEGALQVDRDGVVASGSVDVASVDTKQPQRDEHLRSPDFFDAASFPKIQFRSTEVRQSSGEELEIDGELTIHGVRRPITLKAELEGSGTDHEGKERVGLTASAEISRADFEMRFNAALGSGNLVVADKVKIDVDISAVKSD